MCVCAWMYLYVYMWVHVCVCVYICACMCTCHRIGRSCWDCFKHHLKSQTAKPLDPYLPFFPNFPLSLFMFLFAYPSVLCRIPWQQVNLHSLPGPMLGAFQALPHFSLIPTVGICRHQFLQTRAWSSLKNLSKASALQRKRLSWAGVTPALWTGALCLFFLQTSRSALSRPHSSSGW